MKEILRTTDMVILSFAQHVLEEASIAFVVLDTHMSVTEGSIGVLIPRRLMVAEADLVRAKSALTEAGLEAALYRDA